MIKQLVFLMGWEAFTTGMKIYFKEFKWTNTSLHDFIACLQKGNDLIRGQGTLMLDSWADKWLRTKGTNKITYEFTHEDGIIKKFKIRQAFCQHGDEVYRK